MIGGDMLDRVAKAINPRAFGPMEGHYLFQAWQKEDQERAYKAAEDVLRAMRDNPTYEVLVTGGKSLSEDKSLDVFYSFKDAWIASMNAALRLGRGK